MDNDSDSVGRSVSQCTITKPRVLRPTMFFVVFCLYVCFCVSCGVIPDSVEFGHSLCFAYTFALTQMLQVAILMRTESINSFCLLSITLVTGCVFPTMQMYNVMQYTYSAMQNDAFAWLYMFKEVSVCLITAPKLSGSNVPYVSRAFMMICFSWVLIEFMIHLFVDQDMASNSVIGVLSDLLRFSPQFCIAILTLVHLMNKNDIFHSPLPKTVV